MKKAIRLLPTKLQYKALSPEEGIVITRGSGIRTEAGQRSSLKTDSGCYKSLFAEGLLHIYTNAQNN